MTIDPIEAVELAGKAAKVVLDITLLTRRPSAARVAKLVGDIEALVSAVRAAVRD